MSWALMRNPEGLDCDLFVSAWDLNLIGASGGTGGFFNLPLGMVFLDVLRSCMAGRHLWISLEGFEFMAGSCETCVVLHACQPSESQHRFNASVTKDITFRIGLAGLTLCRLDRRMCACLSSTSLQLPFEFCIGESWWYRFASTSRVCLVSTEVLVVPNRHKSVYTRLWCGYEAYVASEDAKTIQIATAPAPW